MERTIKIGDRFTGKGAGTVVWTVTTVWPKEFPNVGTLSAFEAQSTGGQKRVFYADQVNWITE